MTVHGAGVLQVIICKVKPLLPDQPNRIIAAGSRPNSLERYWLSEFWAGWLVALLAGGSVRR